MYTFPPPAIAEIGTAQGFDFMLVDRGGAGHEALMNARNQLIGMAMQDERVASIRPNGMEDVPQYRVDVDWEKVGAQKLSIAQVHNTLSTAFGSAYVNDFIMNGRNKRVYVQADAPFRMLPEDLDRLRVRNQAENGALQLFASGRWSSGSPRLERVSTASLASTCGGNPPGLQFQRRHAGDGRADRQTAERL